jgi:nucleoside-diphosphate-sugar epimerase
MRTGDDSLVLVTGASGFIGLHTVRACLHNGYRVRAAVRDAHDCSIDCRWADV